MNRSANNARWRLMLVAVVVTSTIAAAAVHTVAAQSSPPRAASSPTASSRGEAWFYQRCSLCHMGRIVKDDTYEPMAPRLEGVLKDATPEREKLVRERFSEAPGGCRDSGTTSRPPNSKS